MWYPANPLQQHKKTLERIDNNWIDSSNISLQFNYPIRFLFIFEFKKKRKSWSSGHLTDLRNGDEIP